MPFGPAALSDGRRFIISLTSSLVGVLLRSGSGICESDGWGELSDCVTRSALDSSQGERGRNEDGDKRDIYVGVSLLFQDGVPVVCHPLSTFVCQRKYWCAFVRVVGERQRSRHLCSLGGVSREC